MSLAAPFLRSRLARRVFVLFVIGALTPIVITSLLSYLHLDSVIRDRQTARLRDYSQTYALAVLQRIELAENVLGMPDNTSPASLERLRDGNWAPFVRAAAILEADGTFHAIRGSEVFPVPDSNARQWLDKGHVWLNVVPREREAAHVVLVAGLTQGHDATLAYVALDPNYVFGEAQQLPYNVSIDIATFSGRKLLHLGAATESRDEAGQSALRRWELPLKPQFDSEAWVVTASEPLATRGIVATLGVFSPLGLIAAVLLVLLLSATQIRRILVPLEALLGATRRVAQRDFDVRVSVSSGDEFEELATSFNCMSESLRVQFDALQALAEIDRLILGSPDVEGIMESLLKRVRYVTGCSCASVILLDGDERQHVRVYAVDDRENLRQPVLRVAFEAASESVAAMEDGMLLELDPERGIPPYAAHLAARGARWATVHPVHGKQGPVAILVLAYPHSPEGNRVAHFPRDFADRLAVALTNLEREERLYTQAHYDELTDLPNRQLLKQRLSQELARSASRNELLALLYIDLDHFKRVNDTLGHGAGDELLKVVAARLATCTKQSDTVARLGGDEFVMVVSALGSPDLAARIGERVLAALAEPLTVNGREYHVRASIGIALFPGDGTTIEDLLKNADTAMYRAKDDGRGRVAYFEQHMNARALERWSLETGLHRALQARQFVLHYQPQFNLHSGAMSGAEALIRWQCPVKGMRPPAEFIPAAEETGLIVEIGAWALTEACEQYQRWREQGVTVPQLAINVCADQLRQHNFVELVKMALMRADMPPWALELEITESVLLSDDTLTAQRLNELVALGVKVALDDFGTGYSSMSYLRRHPVHVIKVDRSFITDIPGNPEAAAIATAVIAMARSLRKQTVAEGVETAAQLAFLKGLGCDAAQGYFFSRPLAADALATFVLNNRVAVEQTIRLPQPLGRVGRA